MKLTRIVLEGCKRLIVAGTHYFEFKPESDQITIIGTNGTGKSTIMNAWTPLPHASKEFIKGGKKITEWEHKGSYYEVISVYDGGGGSHTMIKDKVPLIEEGTASVLTQLCKEHFAVDKELHELMIGKKRFTTMSVNERREWIMRISGGDFSFVMQLFNKVSTKTRDALGAVRHTRQRLIELEKDRVSKDAIVDYKQKLDDINKSIGNVLEFKQKFPVTNGGCSYLTLNNTLDVMGTSTFKIMKGVDEALNTLITLGIDRNSYIDNSATLKSELVIYKNQLTGLLTDLQNVKEKEQLVKESQSLNTLVEELTHITKEVNEILSVYGSVPYFNDIKNSYNTIINFNDVSQELNVILSQWDYKLASSNAKEDCLELKQQRTALEEFCLSTERAIKDLQHRLFHIKNTDDINCPRCAHHWKIGVKENEEAEVTGLIQLQSDKLKTAKEHVIDKTARIDNLQHFLDVKNQYTSLMRGNPLLETLWLLLHESNALKDPKVSIKQLTTTWLNTVTAKSKYETLLTTKQQLEDKIEFIKKLDVDNGNLSFFKEQIQTKISEQYKLIDITQANIVKTNKINETLKYLNDALASVKSSCETIKRLTDETVNTLSVNTIEKVNQQLNNNAYSVNSLLIRSQNSYAVLNELESTLEELTTTYNAYTILVSELSPKEGFVAELLVSFISQLLKDMNAILSALWTYDLEVLMCSKAETELDFKFPVAVKNNEHTPDDINDTSSSQIDGIDFAFKYVVAQYLELSDYPFLLDELAPTFDEVHRRNIMHYVRQLVDTNVCSQMVMISHYSETHSAFVKSEYLVTDAFNVTVPSVYNKNAIFR